VAASWTQVIAAQRLGVTQAYLSMVENGGRAVSSSLASRAVAVLDVPATALPFGKDTPLSRDAASFKEALGALGYPGFAYLQGAIRMNPAEFLRQAVDADDLDSRVIEALPWVAFAYPNLNWEWLTLNAKAHDRQNRLGYVVEMAKQFAGRVNRTEVAFRLAKWEAVLERSRLAAEDTLCKESMTSAERKWLRQHRSREAAHWRLLTDLTVEQLDYGHS
jgi:transcriptional regulator with XRE-family HTH domain